MAEAKLEMERLAPVVKQSHLEQVVLMVLAAAFYAAGFLWRQPLIWVGVITLIASNLWGLRAIKVRSEFEANHFKYHSLELGLLVARSMLYAYQQKQNAAEEAGK